MKLLSCVRMPGPETPPSPEPSLSRREKEQLLQKMYGLAHWIAIIRLFGYQTLPMDKARAEIKPIAEEFGKEKTAEACEVLVEIVPGKEPLARLKSHIRRMAFQILGPEEPPLPAGTEEPAVSPSPETPKKRSAKREAAASTERPIKQPRHLVLNRYEAWLNECGLAFVAVADASRTTPAVKPYVAGLDYIVLREDAKLLVTVRPHLQAKHLKAIGELQKLFGAEYEPVRVWPTEGTDGWNWQEHAIDVSTAEGT
jgi:hypothetical protein